MAIVMMASLVKMSPVMTVKLNLRMRVKMLTERKEAMRIAAETKKRTDISRRMAPEEEKTVPVVSVKAFQT